MPSIQALEGGGFPVRRPFPSGRLPLLDPFLLFDHMGPVTWGPGEAVGAPDHPHRGFETVTYVLAGKMRHRDSAGHSGVLGPGDVQWMTAGAGVVHSELPDPDFKARGGLMNGFQLWVNLPARDKMTRPRYQEIPGEDLPLGESPDGLVRVRVIAGESLGRRAVIETRTPIQYLHITIRPGGRLDQAVPAGFNAGVYLISGEARLGESGDKASEGDLGVFGPGDGVRLEVPAKSKAEAGMILLAGRPLNEPVARYGPFVMNTQKEIEQAIADYQSGKMGRIE